MGGPNQKRGQLPAVTVLDALHDKVFGPGHKQVLEDAGRGGGEGGEKEEDVAVAANVEDAVLTAEDDPMLMLGAYALACELETPKKCKRARTAKSAADGRGRGFTDSVRAIDMPKRPRCAGRECAEIRTVHLHVRKGSRALWIRLDCIDWLVSYAADEHYYQGVSRSDPMSAVAANDYDLEFDWTAKAWDCKISVGIDSGMTLRMSATQLTKDMYEKVAEPDPNNFERFWSKANATIKRKASRAYLRLWAIAAVAGSRQAFEDDVFLQSPNKQSIADRADGGDESQESQATDGVEESQSQEAQAEDVGDESQESLAAKQGC